MIPKLKPHEGSWVAIHTATGRVVELFDRESAISAALTDQWTVKTIGQYLGDLNAEIRRKSLRHHHTTETRR